MMELSVHAGEDWIETARTACWYVPGIAFHGSNHGPSWSVSLQSSVSWKSLKAYVESSLCREHIRISTLIRENVLLSFLSDL